MIEENRKVLITGVQGYIGSVIAKAFKAEKWHVAGLDRSKPRDTVKTYVKDFLKCDYTNHIMTEAFIRKVQPTVIVHCGGTSLVGPSVKDPAEYYKNNVAGTLSLLESIRLAFTGGHTALPTVMFSSSAGVYGNPKSQPLAENRTLKPMSPYGESKLMVEHILRDYATAYNLKSVSFRFFNAAGACADLGQAPGGTHIIARIMESMLDDKSKFTLYGKDYKTVDGTCIRDYVHVKDIAQAHVLAATQHQVEGAEIYNLGTNQGYSNQQIIDECIAHCGDFKYDVGERREGDPDQLIADAKKAQKVLGWEPKHSDLKTIIKDAWNWYNI